MRPFTFFVVALLAIQLLAACGAPSSGATISDNRFSISLKEFGIEPKEIQAKAGPATFVVKNAGAIEHDFMIEGVGKIENLLPGETKTLEVTLRPGTNEIVCSLSGHKEAGMTARLAVSP
ncbi:MAG: cupredoxin domain-containing protein [Chloroflexi bacterium]|nr:cupredoxin domain-containing protein [Chloroflexota bacterium]